VGVDRSVGVAEEDRSGARYQVDERSTVIGEEEIVLPVVRMKKGHG
jgi:hypothetical protein